MTQIDFYVLEDSAADARLKLVCRIAEKAVARDHQVLINTHSIAESTRLDDLLWTFSQGSFLPHRVIVEGEATANTPSDASEPVQIGCGAEPTDGSWDLLINLAADVPEFFSRYQRVAEVVDGSSERRSAGRERFRYYRDRGYKLNTHKV